MSYSLQGPGGKVVPGGGSFSGLGEDIHIMVDISSAFDDTGFKAAADATKNITTITGEHGEAHAKTAEQIREEISPIRSLSWDMLLTGRSISVMNSYLLGNNVILRQMTGLIYSAGAALRIYTSFKDVERISAEMHEKALERETAAILAQKAAGTLGGGAAAASTAVKAAGTVGGMGGGFPGMLAGIAGAALPFFAMQGGGPVKETGNYLLHRGEHVNSSKSNFNNININMHTGAISNEIDQDNMLDDMARRIVRENARRGVYG